jgi:hypothetical protein
MAHQAHNIPWQSLASNLKFVQDNRRFHWRTDLYPKHDPGQGKQLTYFAKGFARVLEEFSRTERAKYPEEHRALELDEVIISTATEERIKNTVKKYKEKDDYYLRSGNSLGLKEKTLPYWINYPEQVMCERCYGPGHVNDSGELLKALLLHGEMDTILNLAAQPNVRLLSRSLLYRTCDYYRGWSEIAATALMAYICLNIFFLKPETYDPTFRKSKPSQRSKSGDEPDYRRASSYQRMLFRCTGSRECDSFTYPHREFFGVAQDQYDARHWDQKYTFGVTSLSNMRKHSAYKPHVLCPFSYLPTRSDIPVVMDHLRSAGLPTELALYVLELAEYSPKRRSVVPDDPLHVQNRTELRRYLNYCWQLLVRCDILAKACGTHFKWEYYVNEAIMNLWGHNNSQQVAEEIGWEECEILLEGDVGGLGSLWKFI